MTKRAEIYRAPELTDGLNFDNKVDIWSMGCILYELATTKPAFVDDMAMFEWYFRDKPFHVKLDDHFEETDRATICESIQKMLHKDPSMRPSARTLYDEFRHHWTVGRKKHKTGHTLSLHESPLYQEEKRDKERDDQVPFAFKSTFPISERSGSVYSSPHPHLSADTSRIDQINGASNHRIVKISALNTPPSRDAIQQTQSLVTKGDNPRKPITTPNKKTNPFKSFGELFKIPSLFNKRKIKQRRHMTM